MTRPEDLPGLQWMPGMLVKAVVEGAPALYRLAGAAGLEEESHILVYESRLSALSPGHECLYDGGCYDYIAFSRDIGPRRTVMAVPARPDWLTKDWEYWE